jgi:hypothetical protein
MSVGVAETCRHARPIDDPDGAFSPLVGPLRRRPACGTSPLMRRLLLLLLLLATVALAVTFSASSARSAARARVTCGAKALTFLFWPDGHNAIASINFQSFPYPHMEVYKPAAGTFPDPNEVGIIEFTSTGQPAGGFAKSCTAVKAKLTSSKPLRASTGQPTALTCAFPKPAQMEFSKSTSPVAITLRAILPSKKRVLGVEVSARIMDAPGASTLKYDPKYCSAQPPPS